VDLELGIPPKIPKLWKTQLEKSQVSSALWSAKNPHVCSLMSDSHGFPWRPHTKDSLLQPRKSFTDGSYHGVARARRLRPHASQEDDLRWLHSFDWKPKLEGSMISAHSRLNGIAASEQTIEHFCRTPVS
jgi:hypothetical protein